MFHSKITKLLIVVVAFSLAGCSYKDIPTEFPTPPPKAQAEPLAKIDLKRDGELEKEIAKIAEAAKGKVGVAAVLLETGDTAMLNGDQRFPMQSVYKLPISMSVMDQVRLDKLDLDEKIGVTKEDMVRAGMRSPLRDGNPNGGEFTIRELIRLAMVESDGTASDVLMRVAGEGEVQAFLTQIGISEMKVLNTEKEMGRDWQTQYQNYSTPLAAAELLRWLDASVSTASDSDRGTSGEEREPTELEILLKFMAESNPGAKRLKGELPTNTYVAHKTGTSGTQNNITAATNDIGIIKTPRRQKLRHRRLRLRFPRRRKEHANPSSQRSPKRFGIGGVKFAQLTIPLALISILVRALPQPRPPPGFTGLDLVHAVADLVDRHLSPRHLLHVSLRIRIIRNTILEAERSPHETLPDPKQSRTARHNPNCHRKQRHRGKGNVFHNS